MRAVGKLEDFQSVKWPVREVLVPGGVIRQQKKHATRTSVSSMKKASPAEPSFILMSVGSSFTCMVTYQSKVSVKFIDGSHNLLV